MGNTYNIGDCVLVWWRGEEVKGTVIEITRTHNYRVRLATSEICFRTESDLEWAIRINKERR